MLITDERETGANEIVDCMILIGVHFDHASHAPQLRSHGMLKYVCTCVFVA